MVYIKILMKYNKIKVFWETQINKGKIIAKIKIMMGNSIVHEFNIEKKIIINNLIITTNINILKQIELENINKLYKIKRNLKINN